MADIPPTSPCSAQPVFFWFLLSVVPSGSSEDAAEALGPPLVLTVREREIYRWSLERPYDLAMYVLLNAPEHPEMAHMAISDGPRFQARLVESFLVTTRDEAEQMVDRVVCQ